MDKMFIFLDSYDSVPIQDAIQVSEEKIDFSDPFKAWLAVLVESLNEMVNNVEAGFNLLQAPPFTTTEIVAMFGDGELSNGILLYDTVLDEYVGMQAGALVKFTTTSYP